MRRAPTGGGVPLAGKPVDFSPLVGTSRGGAAGAFFPGVGVSGRLTARARRRKKPKSEWTYNEWVYVTVEVLWNQLSEADKLQWLYSWKPKCLSARDYFGKFNMVCVYRWGGWVRRPPSQRRVGKVRSRPEFMESVPWDLLPQLGGDFAPVPGSVLIQEQWIRNGFGTGSNIRNACNAAWAVVSAKPWVKTVGLSITNAHYAYYYGSYWGATVYQAYCRLRVVPGTLRVWEPWILRIEGGWTGYGAKSAGFWAGGEYFRVKDGYYENAELGWRSTDKGIDYNCQQVGGFFQPPYPPVASQWYGVQGGLTLPEIRGR